PTITLVLYKRTLVEYNHVGCACGRPGAAHSSSDPCRVQRAHGRDVAGRARPNDRVDGVADDRGGAGWAGPLVVGGDGLPVDDDGEHAAVREAVGHLRAPADVPGGDRDLRDRVDAVWPVP